MTVTPYTVEYSRSNNDGLFYGALKNGSELVAALTEGHDVGKRKEDDFVKWARGVAAAHKAGLTPPPTHVVTRTFSL